MTDLTIEQSYVYDKFMAGQSMFITGPAGCGKSFLIHHIRTNSRGLNVAVTALTGTAACLINGQTLHGWGGLRLAEEPGEIIAKNIVSRMPPIAKRWRETDVLIIDEVSMMSAELFNKLHIVAQKVRHSTDFFGGIQVIFCGDFAQLPPIASGSSRFCFESSIWKEYLDTNTYYLSKVMRQDDPIFQRLLSEIRLGTVSEKTKTILKSRFITDEAEADVVVTDDKGKETGKVIKATLLFPKKKDVSRINEEELAKLLASGVIQRTYQAEDTAVNKSSRKIVQIDAKKKEQLNNYMNAPVTLQLAMGAQVMLIKNKSLEDGLVNGSRGVVTSFGPSNLPIVMFDNGEEVTVGTEPFEMESGDAIITRRQIPLILAWAITIHKCQGATLTNVITDLREVFGDAQAYVTLSRVKSLEGLFIINIDFKKITCNSKVRTYYESLTPLSSIVSA